MRTAIDTSSGGAAPGTTQHPETLWLLGQPHLSDYLEFVRTRTRGGADADPRLLADEWRRANDLYYDLEQQEAGSADDAGCDPLDSAMEPLADELRADAFFRGSFDTLPSDIRMVELDRLIVSQTHVARDFTDSLRQRLSAASDPEALFRFCLPLDRPQPPVTAEKFGSDRYVFSSESTDFRPQAPVLLRPEQLEGLKSHGPVARVLAVPVGFGSNFLMAVRSGSRLLLQNGYHRAYALRAAGFTHVPCIVQEVTRKDELRIAACEDVCSDPEFYFAAARPPLLRDFFDPRLVKRLPLLPMRTVVEVEFKVRMTTIIGS